MPLSLSPDGSNWLWLGEPHRHKTLSPTLSHKLSAPQTFTLLTRPSSDAVQAFQHLVLAHRVISSRWGARRAAVSGIHGFEGSLGLGRHLLALVRRHGFHLRLPLDQHLLLLLQCLGLAHLLEEQMCLAWSQVGMGRAIRAEHKLSQLSDFQRLSLAAR